MRGLVKNLYLFVGLAGAISCFASDLIGSQFELKSFQKPKNRSLASIWGKSSQELKENYFEFSRKFSETMCSHGEDFEYERLLKKFRGSGYYLPDLNDVTLDKEAIRNGLPVLYNKKKWIHQTWKSTKKYSRKTTLKKFKSIENQLENLVDKRKKFFIATSEEDRSKLRQESALLHENLDRIFSDLMNSAPLLKSFGFPNDHLSRRISYENVKDRKTIERAKEANKIFFERQIYEDGTFNKNHGDPDIYLRSTGDTIALRLRSRKNPFLTQSLQYDLKDFIKMGRDYLRQGRSKILRRLKRWEDRTSAAISFYETLLKRPEQKEDQDVISHSKARAQLKDFVLKKQAKVVEFLTAEKEAVRSLWALNTILINEVGQPDNRNFLDRKDVAQVVFNRFRDGEFSVLNEKDSIYPYLNDSLKKSISKYHWLGLLFKEGEFSFSYYYIPSVVRIFCPDRSGVAKRYLNLNTDLAIKLLREPNWDFSAVRYFSRVSMLGRIDMASVWVDYERLPDRVGFKVAYADRLKKAFERKKASHEYYFYDDQGILNQVFSAYGNYYVRRDEGYGYEYYDYRDPNRFMFFAKK